MQKMILAFLCIGCSVFSQTPEEKRDTMFLVFNAKPFKSITLSKTETNKRVVYKYEYSTDHPVNFIELIADKKRLKVRINREKLWAPSEQYGISWFDEDLANTEVIYIVEKINNKEIVRRVLKVNTHIIHL